MDEELRIQITARRGREVKRHIFRHYLPRHKSLSTFFENFKEIVGNVLDELLKR